MSFHPAPSRHYHPIRKWALRISLFLTLLSLTLLTIIQVSGTSISTLPPPQHYDLATAIGSTNPLLSIQLPYYELEPRPYGVPWTLRIYLNSACAQPTVPISHEFGIVCFYHSPGHEFALEGLLQKMDKMPLYWTNYSVPTATARSVRLHSVEMGAGFAFYALGMLGAALVVVLWFVRCCGEAPRSKKVSGTPLVAVAAGVAALCDLLASAYLTARARGVVVALSKGVNAEYVEGAVVGRAFLELTWGAVASQSLAAGLLGWRWWVGRRMKEWEDEVRGRELAEREGEVVVGAPPPYERSELDRRVDAHEQGMGEVLTPLEMTRQTEERALRDRERLPGYEATSG